MLRLEGETLVIGEGCNLCGACTEVCEMEALVIPEATGPSPRPEVPPDGVWIFAEQRGGVLAPVTAELLGEGRRLAEELQVPVAAVLFGEDVASLAPALLAAGAHKVYLAEHPRLKDFLEETYAAALTALARQYRPEIILAGATYAGRAFIPRVAASLKTGLTADCTAFAIDPEKRLLLQTRPAFGGNIMATIITPRTFPQMATARPGVFKARPPADFPEGEVIPVDTAFLDGDGRSRFVATVEEIKERVPLAAAEVIVAGGRGLKDAKNFRLLEELADLLGAAVGATRAAVDAGWITLCPPDRPDRQDRRRPGFTSPAAFPARPSTWWACSPPTSSWPSTKTPRRRIFQVADVGMVGDLFEIIPALIQEIKKDRE